MLAACESATEPAALDRLADPLAFLGGGDPNISCDEGVAYMQDSHVTFGDSLAFSVNQCGNIPPAPAPFTLNVVWRVHYKLNHEDPSTHHYWARRIRFALDGTNQDSSNYLYYYKAAHAWVDTTVSAVLDEQHDGVIWAMYPRTDSALVFGPAGYGQPEIWGHVWLYKDPPTNVAVTADLGSATIRWKNEHRNRTIDSTYVTRFHVDADTSATFAFAWNDSVFVDNDLPPGDYHYQVWHQEAALTSYMTHSVMRSDKGQTDTVFVGLVAPHTLVCGSYDVDGVFCNWTNGGSTAIEVYRRDTAFGAWSYVTTVSGGSPYGYFAETGLTPEQFYWYRVRHVSGSYASLWSNTDGATAGGNDPGFGDP
jgi:hypothetical protein